jgi:CelD/BcsL family acetyltransferase involved in cellulose biosynthesis
MHGRVTAAWVEPLGRRGTPMKLSVLKTADAVEAIEREWAALLLASGDNVLHLSHRWFLLGFKTFHAQDRLHVIVVRGEDGELNGIVPLVVVKERFRWMKVRMICFARNQQNPSNDFIFRKGFELQCLKAVLDHLCGFALWQIIDLQMTNKATAAAIKEYLDAKRIPYKLRDNRRSPYIQIDGDWNGYWARRSNKFKKSIRNKINKANNVGYSVEKIRFDRNEPDALADMLRISAASWKRDIGTDLLTKKDNWSFYKELCAVYGCAGYISLYFLNVQGMRAAFEFHIEDRNIVYPIRADYDRVHEKLSPGSILEYEIIKSTFERGDIKEYNSCGHTYKYLMNWTKADRPFINIEIFNLHSSAMLLYLFEFWLFPKLRGHRLFDVIKSKIGYIASH